mmetsp:Transcript_20810/g.32184  ORF Transcript_20810/g.32184 Transcript_20810/m.32184 type:complete len:87 (-) Transcript_20810:43-303(-)
MLMKSKDLSCLFKRRDLGDFIGLKDLRDLGDNKGRFLDLDDFPDFGDDLDLDLFIADLGDDADFDRCNLIDRGDCWDMGDGTDLDD